MAKKKKSELTIPVLVQEDVVLPASLKKKAIKSVTTTIKDFSVDEQSFGQCLDAAGELLATGSERLAESLPAVALDTIGFEFSIGASGAVGFMGTGLEAEIVATVQVTLKLLDEEE